VTVGEALTEARYQAGLSVDELSQRTRIRETVIRSIERDDYDACGGDVYVRGYVRAIAGAVGIDAQPLIREYDLRRAASAGGSAGLMTFPGAQAPGVAGPAPTTRALPPVPVREPGTAALDRPAAPRPGGDATMLDLPPVPAADPAATRFEAADPAATRFDLPPVTDDAGPDTSLDPYLSADPAATRFDLPPVTDVPANQPPRFPPPVGPDLMAAGYDLPPGGGAAPASAAPSWTAQPRSASPPARPAWPAVAAATGAMQGPPGPRHGTRRNRHLPVVAALLVALVVAAAGLLVDHLVTGGTPTGRLAATSRPQTPAAKASASHSATAAPTTPATKPASLPVSILPIAAASAFGPDGLSDGDNPQVASNAIARNAQAPWSTQWYATPDFGMLKHGTGLLLDLGHVVTITSVRVDLSPFHGVNLQLKAGDGTAPAALTTAATVTDSGGVLRVVLRHPATARYLLIWFTLLPPDGQGHFAESVSGVLVNGRA
jgi:Helix-turn-helix domain